MNVLFFVVNYKMDDHLGRFVQSIAAAQAVCQSANVDVHVLDNSQKTEHEVMQLRSRLGVAGVSVTVHSPGTNDGYFGGLRRAQSLVPEGTDCVIYCNPDVLLDPDFLLGLERILGSTGGVVAPTILSLKDGIDLNPQYRQRLSEGKLRLLQWIYANRLTYVIFNELARAKERFSGWRHRSRQAGFTSMPIYAAHGAVIIFTDVEFFRRLPAFPCFLYGEELFVAEEARKSGVSVVYEPSLRVRDVRHVSISQLPGEFRRSLALKSVTFILNRYYSEHHVADS